MFLETFLTLEKVCQRPGFRFGQLYPQTVEVVVHIIPAPLGSYSTGVNALAADSATYLFVACS